MHNHDDKYPSRSGFEPGTTRLQAPVDMNEPSRPAPNKLILVFYYMSNGLTFETFNIIFRFFLLMLGYDLKMC